MGKIHDKLINEDGHCLFLGEQTTNKECIKTGAELGSNGGDMEETGNLQTLKH